jgi:transposase
MKTPIPPIHETAEELRGLLKAERDVQKQRRLQALYFLQSQQVRTRRQVAQLLGVSRNTVGRWLAAYESGGLPQMLIIGKAPGKVPLLSPAMQQALRARLAQPQGFASYKAIWQWLRQEYGLPIAYKTVPRFVRYQLRARLKVPRPSHIKKRRARPTISGESVTTPAGNAARAAIRTTASR